MITKKRMALGIGVLATAGILCAPYRSHAEHFDVALKVQAPGAQAEAGMDTTPPIGGVNPRPIVLAHVGDTLRISWQLKSGFPHGTMRGVTVHFFVVKEEKTGQKPVPDPAGEEGVVDSRFQMDFAPKASASGSFRFKASSPGSYLVRLQSEDTHQEHGHEHFAAIDLEIQ